MSNRQNSDHTFKLPVCLFSRYYLEKGSMFNKNSQPNGANYHIFAMKSKIALLHSAPVIINRQIFGSGRNVFRYACLQIVWIFLFFFWDLGVLGTKFCTHTWFRIGGWPAVSCSESYDSLLLFVYLFVCFLLWDFVAQWQERMS